MNTATKRLFWVVFFLLLHFSLRAHHATLQRAYVDEGYHAKHAVEAWRFDRHPAAYAHGRLLLYYWLGLFQGVGQAYLHTARTSVALISTLTAAIVYLLGRLLRDHKTGMLALGLYAVFPMALFFERMAMSDPLAAVFVGAVAWWSVVFARRPTLRRGAMVGVFLALAALSKLSAATVALLPVAAAVFYGQFIRLAWHHNPNSLEARVVVRQRYIPGLVVAACVALLMMLPLLVPIYLSQATDSPLPLVISYTYETEKHIAAYIQQVWPVIEDFVTLLLPVAAGIVSLLMLVARVDSTIKRTILWLWLWLIVLVAPPILLASISASRYFMPAAVPFVVLVAYLATIIPASWLRAAAICGIGLWMVWFALPFVNMALNAPESLPLRGQNFNEYQSGLLAAEPGVQKTALYLNADGDEAIQEVFITWRICYNMYFYLERDVTCLSQIRPLGNLWELLDAELENGEAAYMVISDYAEPFFQRIPNLGWEHIAMYPRVTPSGERQVDIWKVFWLPEPE